MKPILLFLFTCCALIAYTQINPAIQWQKSLGGSYFDYAYGIQQTKDGGYIVAGTSYSGDGDVTGNHGANDFWIVKLDAIGNIQWQKALGGTSYDYGYSIQQTKDGGYILAGSTASNDGDVIGNNGAQDCWVVKLDSLGNIQWQKPLGGTDYDGASDIKQTTDGGYIMAGWSFSNDGDVSGHHGSQYLQDYWIVKLDRTGQIQWQKSLGGSTEDQANRVQQTKDGGFIVAGYSDSHDGDVSGNHGAHDYWVVKLDITGNIQWEKSYGGTTSEYANSIEQTKDNGYIIAGASYSADGDVSGHHGDIGYTTDYWIVKLDTVGNIQWQKSLGGTNSDFAIDIQQTNDGGYIVAGETSSADGDVSNNHGGYDYWVVKLNKRGYIQKEESFGGTSDDFATCIQQTNGGGFVITGSSSSNDGDILGHHGSNLSSDYWILKLRAPKIVANTQTIFSSENSNAVVEKNTTTAIHIQPNPSHNGLFTADMGNIKNNLFISVTDNSGRHVYAKQLSSAQQFTIQLNNKPKGIYYLHVRFDGGEETKKLVVE